MKFILPVAALVALVATPALATTIIESATIASADAGTTSQVSFAKFNASLGTLTSVTLSFDADTTASGTLDNTANVEKTQDVTTGATAGLSGHGFTLTSAMDQGTADFSVPAKTTVDIGPFTGSGTDSSVLTSALSPFEGVGNLVFSFSRTSQFSATGTPHLHITPKINGDATLTYNYSAVGAAPEPATWAMLGVGVFGLGGVLRRQRGQGPAATRA